MILVEFETTRATPRLLSPRDRLQSWDLNIASYSREAGR